jgi:hypothetical protein
LRSEKVVPPGPVSMNDRLTKRARGDSGTSELLAGTKRATGHELFNATIQKRKFFLSSSLFLPTQLDYINTKPEQ